MARRSPYSLDELMVRAALPGLPGGDARRKGRALAMRLGVPIPEALAKRCVTHHTRVRLRVKRPAPPTPAVSGDTMPATALYIPKPLREWRRGAVGRVLGVSARGVVLFEHGREARYFTDADAAIAAIRAA